MKKTKTTPTKILIVALTGLAFVFGACSNDNEPGDSKPDTKKKRISKIDLLWERNDEMGNYSYSSAESFSLSYSSGGLIKSSDYYYKYTAQYNGTTSIDEIKYVTDYVYGQDKITVTNYDPDSNTSASWDYYIKNGVIIGDNNKRIAYDDHGVLHEEISIPSPEYVYDSNNRLIKKVNYDGFITFNQEKGIWEPTKSTYNYIWTNNNLTSIKWEYESRDGVIYSGTLVNSYSSLSSFNLPNQFFSGGNIFNIILSLQGFYGPTSKNLLESSKNNYNVDQSGLVFPEIYEYEFDKDGYPIKVTIKYNHVLMDTDMYVYIYTWEEY